jgi:prepilin-type N-terminal cleavage/methylation domain-containing protein
MKNKILKIIKRGGEKGFSLIEMLIVITIIGIGLVGVVSFFNMNLTSQYEVKNEVIAAGLAQEGVELMRSARDYQLGAGAKSWSDITSSWVTTTTCKTIDRWSFMAATPSHDCYTAALPNTKVCLNSANFYQQCGNAAYSTGEVDTGMTRTISVAQGVPSCASCLKVTCSVTWNGRETKAVDTLYPNSY